MILETTKEEATLSAAIKDIKSARTEAQRETIISRAQRACNKIRQAMLFKYCAQAATKAEYDELMDSTDESWTTLIRLAGQR